MNADLKTELEKKAAELTTKEAELYIALQAVEQEIKPHIERRDRARHEWYLAHSELMMTQNFLKSAGVLQ